MPTLSESGIPKDRVPAVSSQMFSVAGKRALITGSSQGIGLALARGFASAGAHVILNGRDPQKLLRASASITDECQAVVDTVPFDVTVEHEVRDGIATIEETVGPVDIVINNAGLQRRAPITDFTLTDWDDLIGTNLTSVFLVSREIGRAMSARGSGKIINIASVQSRLVRPGIAAYSATKGGVALFTAGLAADLGPSGIQVNALAPGYIATELTRPLVEDAAFSAWVTRHTPSGRWGETSDLVGAAIFLASQASDFVNGQVLYVDGGMSTVL